MTIEKKKAHDHVELLASGTRLIGTGTGDSCRLAGTAMALVFELDVTATVGESGDSLDVYVQTMIDGTNWVDVLRFTQCVGNGGAKRHFSKLPAAVAMATFENGAALAAGSQRAMLGDEWRVRWVITEAGGGTGSGSGSGAAGSGAGAYCSFTFSVHSCPM